MRIGSYFVLLLQFSAYSWSSSLYSSW